MASEVSSSCRAAGFPALGVATNKHGKVRKTGEMNILEYDRHKSGGMKVTRSRREVRKVMKAERPHTSPDAGNAMRASHSLGSLGDGLRPGSAAHSRPDKGVPVQSSNGFGSFGDGLRPGSAAHSRPNNGDFAQVLRSSGNGLQAGSAVHARPPNADELAQPLSSVGNLRPASAANSRPNKAAPLQPLGSVGSPGNGLQPGGDAPHALSSFGGLGNSLRPGSAVNARPMNLQTSGSFDSLGKSLRPGSAVNSQAAKQSLGEFMKASNSFGNVGDNLRPGSAACSRPTTGNALMPASSMGGGLRPGSAANSRLQPSNSYGSLVESLRPGSAANSRPQPQSSNSIGNGLQSGSVEGDALASYQGDNLNLSKSASTQWLEPSKSAVDFSKQQSQSGFSTDTGGSTWQKFGPTGDNGDEGVGVRLRRPNSSERRMAPLQKKKPGARVTFGSNPLFSPTGSCFPFQIGETHNCSAFGNGRFKDPPAAGFKYWRDFKGSGGSFLGM